MKNITKKKIVLVTLGFLLGFSIPILTNSNKVDIQKESLPKTNALTQILLHSYDFEGDTVGQDPSGVTLSVIEPAGSGTANVDNLGDAQQNHVAVHKDGGTDRVELRDNISYYGNTFDAGVFHCKIYHDDSLFGILFHDDIGTLFRLDWYDGIIGRWSPHAEYTYYNYNQWYDVVVYFNLSLGWMFEIDGVRFGDEYAYAFEHGGSGGLEWIRWCSAFSGGGNGFFRVDDVEFYYYEQIPSLRNYIMTPGAPYNWIDASGGTELLLGDDGYAAIALPFNFQLYNETFSTIYLCSNGYLSFTDTTPYQFSNVPFPSADPTHTYMIAPFWDDLQPASGGGSGNIYVQSFGTYWVAEWLNIYRYGGGPLVGSFELILHESGEIIFNYDYIDYTGGGYTCGLNLGVDTDYYNSYQGLNDLTDDFSIQFAYEIPDHDLVVSLETPIMAEVGNSYIINATVTNSGLNDEYDVDLLLYLDDILEDSITISSLPVGASETINYMWTPTDLGEYNFSVYAPPVPGELLIENNLEFKTIYIAIYSEISGPVAIFRNVLPWGYNVTEPILNMYGIDYTIYNSSDMGTVVLTQYEKVIIESDQDQLFYDTLGSYIPWFESYAVNGGILEIHACDGGWNGGYWVGYYLMPGGIDQIHTSTDYISINILGHPIVNNPHIITDTELDGWSTSAHGSFITYPANSKQVLLDSNTLNPVFIELDFGEGTILASMQTLEFSYYQGYSNIIENVVLFNPDALLITTPDSSSEWETDTSHYIYWGSSGSISNVKLELYKDDVFVMEIISSTPNDGEYLWAIPSGLDDSAQYQIKISDVTNPATDDFSDYFEILTPVIDSLTVTTPDSLTAWEMGTSQDITWTSIGSIADVKIELYKDGVFEMEIIASTANDGSYNWGIPTDLEDGIDYQIRISDVLNPATYDESPNFAMTSADIPDEIPSYNLYIVIVIMCVVSVILLKKRFKLIK